MKRLSIGEFEKLPDEVGYRLELVRGLVVREPAPGELHAVVDLNLAVALHSFVRKHRLGRVLTNAAFVLFPGQQTVRVPDIAFVRRRRLQREPQPEMLQLAPDLAVEILSRHNRALEMRDKITDYLGAGAQQVWIVDPKKRAVTVHGRSGVTLLTASDLLLAREVLPGFAIPLTEIFRYE